MISIDFFFFLKIWDVLNQLKDLLHKYDITKSQFLQSTGEAIAPSHSLAPLLDSCESDKQLITIYNIG